MADFATWKHENLVQFAKEADADRNRLLKAGIAQANDNANTLRILKNLMIEFDKVCVEFCKVPERNPIYREAKGVFK